MLHYTLPGSLVEESFFFFFPGFFFVCVCDLEPFGLLNVKLGIAHQCSCLPTHGVFWIKHYG